MTDALEGREGTVSIGGRAIAIRRSADDISGLAREEEELPKIDECLDETPKAYNMEISAKMAKQMTNNTAQHQHRDQNKWTDP